MANYTAASALEDLDTIACMYQKLKTALGVLGTESGTTSKGAKSIWDRVITSLESTAAYSIAANLVGPAKTIRENSKAFSGESGFKNEAADMCQAYLRGLNTELDGSIDSWLTYKSYRVASEYADVHHQVFNQYLSRANVFPPVTDCGSLARGASAWTYTGSSGVDAHYGPAQLELSVPTGSIGGATGMFTLTCQQLAGTTEVKTAYMDASSASGTTVDVGSGSNIYTNVSGVVATGGTEGDLIHIRTKLLRDVSGECA